MMLKQFAAMIAYRIIGYRAAAITANTWDEEYRTGSWDYLGKLENLGGLVSILGYCQHLEPASILDVGCGAGLLARKLKALSYSNYVGIDLSEEAIGQANSLKDSRTRFVAADADNFQTDQAFDVIVFNQSIYYMRDPEKVISRYARFLTRNGRIIVSMYDGPQTREAWKPILRAMPAEDSMTIRQGRGGVTTKLLKAA